MSQDQYKCSRTRRELDDLNDKHRTAPLKWSDYFFNVLDAAQVPKRAQSRYAGTEDLNDGETRCRGCGCTIDQHPHDVTEGKREVLKLAELLKGKVDADAEVMKRATKWFAPMLQLATMQADRELALEAYDLAKMGPSKSTTRLLGEKAGFKVGELPLFPHSNLFKCWDALGNGCILKPLKDSEYTRAACFKALRDGLEDKDLPHVPDFSLIDSRILREGGHRKEDTTERPEAKWYMVMPRFCDVLESIPNQLLGAMGASRLWAQISAGLTALHELGVAHMDIKPGNIAVSDTNHFFLIDLNSVAPFGRKTESTEVYIPRDKRNQRSSLEVDWWMLAMTLCEKCCGEASVEFGNSMTYRGKDYESEEVLSFLESNLPSKAVLNDLGKKLKASASDVQATPTGGQSEVVWDTPPRRKVEAFTINLDSLGLSPPHSKKKVPAPEEQPPE